MTKLIIAGGSGYLGRTLSAYFQTQGYSIVVLTRQHRLDQQGIRYIKWDGKSLGYWVQELEGATAVINLNGKSVDCRYTATNKELIYDTRIDATHVLGEAIRGLKQPPKVWINAASATIYRHAEDREMDETTGELGTGFSVDVCKKWEAAFMGAECPDTRKVILRIAIVLGKHGGALQPLKSLAKLGFGGKQGNGRQYFSWIHEADFCGIVDHAITNDNAEGVYNVSTPNPITNKVIMKEIRNAVKMPFGLPMPRWLLELGAAMINTETELILKSRRVVPRRLLSEGYTFQFPQIHDALRDI
jgi:uncharacterized protein (TIGR01777 family)